MRQSVIYAFVLLLGLPAIGRCQDGADGPSAEEKIKHVQQTAEHRHTAALESQAQNIFDLTLAHARELLEKRLAELERLQAQIHDLQVATRPGKHLVICMQSAIVSRTRLQEAGLKLPGIDLDHVPSQFVEIAQGRRQGQAAPEPGVEVCDAEAFAKLVAAQSREKVLRTLGGISLHFGGRYSSTAVGLEIPTLVALADGSAQIELEMLGTTIDAKSTVLLDRKVRLNVLTRTSTVDPTRGVTLGGIALPCLKFGKWNTDCELELGQTAVIGGFPSQQFHRLAKNQGPSELYVLFTPVLVDAPPPVDAQPVQAPTAQTPAETRKK